MSVEIPVITDSTFENADQLRAESFDNFTKAVAIRESVGIFALGNIPDNLIPFGYKKAADMLRLLTLHTHLTAGGQGIDTSWQGPLVRAFGVAGFAHELSDFNKKTGQCLSWYKGLPERIDLSLQADDSQLSPGFVIGNYPKNTYATPILVTVDFKENLSDWYQFYQNRGAGSFHYAVAFNMRDHVYVVPATLQSQDNDLYIAPYGKLRETIPHGTKFQILNSNNNIFSDPYFVIDGNYSAGESTIMYQFHVGGIAEQELIWIHSTPYLTVTTNDTLRTIKLDHPLSENVSDGTVVFVQSYSAETHYVPIGIVTKVGQTLEYQTRPPATGELPQDFESESAINRYLTFGSLDKTYTSSLTKNPRDLYLTQVVLDQYPVEIDVGDIVFSKILMKYPIGMHQKRPLEITTDKIVIIGHATNDYAPPFVPVFAYRPKIDDVARMVGLERSKPLKHNSWYVGKLFKYDGEKWSYIIPTEDSPKEPTLVEYYGYPFVFNYFGSWVLSEIQTYVKLSKTFGPFDFLVIDDKFEWYAPSASIGGSLTIYRRLIPDPDTVGIPIPLPTIQYVETISWVPGQKITFPKEDFVQYFAYVTWFYPDGL